MTRIALVRGEALAAELDVGVDREAARFEDIGGSIRLIDVRREDDRKSSAFFGTPGPPS
jgi:hypothetical protein